MKKLLSLVLTAAVPVLMLAGCGKYSSEYSAVGFVHSNTSDNAYMDFYTFDGTMVFELDGGSGKELKYKAKLEHGSAEVFCDRNGNREKLFTLNAGDELTSSVNDLSSDTVYIIVETEGKCENGDLEFTVA